MLSEQSSFRQSMSWLHTWTGLVLSWLLFFMFVTGTAGYFDTEIDLWMQPEIQQQALLSKKNNLKGSSDNQRLGLEAVQIREGMTSSEKIIQASIPRLQHIADDADFWRINLPINRNQPWTNLRWSGGSVKDDSSERFSALTSKPLVARDTGGGQWLYKMHWKLNYISTRLAEWLVGLATVFMLLALITGIVIHKKIFKDFFTYRPNKSQRSWLDAHNLLSVPALPFYLMITYSGLVFLSATYMPYPVVANYGLSKEGRNSFFQEVFPRYPVPEASGNTQPLYPVHQLLKQADLHWGKEQVRAVEIYNPSDQNAVVIFWENRTKGPMRQSAKLVFNGVTGELIQEYPASHSPTKDVYDLLLGLHEGGFAYSLLRWFYFMSGLAGSAMIATGSLLWCVKRRKRYASEGRPNNMGLQFVERMNAGVFLGLPIAIAAYFWANRLLPLSLTDRGLWEADLLFLSWLGVLIWSVFRPINQLWHELLLLGALSYGLLPLLNALTTNRGLLDSLNQQDWVFAGFDLTMLVLGGLLLFGQRLLLRKNAITKEQVTNLLPKSDTIKGRSRTP